MGGSLLGSDSGMCHESRGLGAAEIGFRPRAVHIGVHSRVTLRVWALCALWVPCALAVSQHVLRLDGAVGAWGLHPDSATNEHMPWAVTPCASVSPSVGWALTSPAPPWIGIARISEVRHAAQHTAYESGHGGTGCYLTLGPHSKEGGMSSSSPSSCVPSSWVSAVLSLPVTQGGNPYLLVLSFKHLLFALPGSRGLTLVMQVQIWRHGYPLLAAKSYNPGHLLPCSEVRSGAPSFLWPPLLFSQPGRGLPGDSATREADSPLNAVAGDGAAPGVAGRGPGQGEAVSVHIQAADIQRGAWGPRLLGCRI